MVQHLFLHSVFAPAHPTTHQTFPSILILNADKVHNPAPRHAHNEQLRPHRLRILHLGVESIVRAFQAVYQHNPPERKYQRDYRHDAIQTSCNPTHDSTSSALIHLLSEVHLMGVQSSIQPAQGSKISPAVISSYLLTPTSPQ